MTDIQKCFDELMGYAALLNSLYGGWHPQASLQSKVSATTDPRCPANLVVLDVVKEIFRVYDACDAYDIVDLVTFTDGVTKALAVRKVHDKVKAMSGLHPTWQKRAAPCPACGSGMGGWSGEGFVGCGGCEVRMTLDEYDEWCFELAKKGKR